MTRRRNRLRPAFTLLEITLALAMIATLALPLYMCLNIAVRAKDAAFNAVTPIRAAVVAADVVRQDFESVLPPTGILAGEFIGTSLGGGGSGELAQLTFYSVGNDATVRQPVADAAGGPVVNSVIGTNDQPLAEGVRRVDLLVRTDVTPPVLVRRVTRNLLAQTEPIPDDEVLCRNVRTFALRYYDGFAWQTEWDSTALGDTLPTAVEMTLEITNPTARPGVDPEVQRIVRLFPLPCSKPADDTEEGLQ